VGFPEFAGGGDLNKGDVWNANEGKRHNSLRHLINVRITISWTSCCLKPRPAEKTQSRPVRNAGAEDCHCAGHPCDFFPSIFVNGFGSRTRRGKFKNKVDDVWGETIGGERKRFVSLKVHNLLVTGFSVINSVPGKLIPRLSALTINRKGWITTQQF